MKFIVGYVENQTWLVSWPCWNFASLIIKNEKNEKLRAGKSQSLNLYLFLCLFLFL